MVDARPAVFLEIVEKEGSEVVHRSKLFPDCLLSKNIILINNPFLTIGHLHMTSFLHHLIA
jgi:hypothetical protein